MQPYEIQIPADRRSYVVEEFFQIFDDDVDEDEQSFALVVEIGPDVPDGVSCFQISNDTECYGQRGATEIRIIDNDCKYNNRGC